VALGSRIRNRDLIDNSKFTITTSHFSDRLLRSYLAINNSRVIPNFGHGDAQIPLRHRERSGWIALGRLSPEKGMLQLAADWPTDQALTIIGDGPERAALQDRISQSAIHLEHTMPIEQLRAALPRFMGLIVPSRWYEVAPQVVVEAMRVGLPIVAYEGTAVAEDVRLSGAGAVYSDAEELRISLRMVDEQLGDMSEKASNYFLQEWKENVWLDRIESVYAETVKGNIQH
jgi:glycosyltransferase involved in cell wall biosynthesis